MSGLGSKRFKTYHLVEAIKVSEYNALSENNQERIRMILSCGIADMTTGSDIRTMLFNLFPEGTDTYDNLTDMLAYTASPGP